MNLLDTLERLASQAESQQSLLQTEEATKTGLVMPLLAALGYNVFDPSEVTPEFNADVGTKKGEKVDYAIQLENSPVILIECKAFDQSLAIKHASQLYRYFSVTDARIGVLTNGHKYWFYSDIDSANRMDQKPFFEFDLLSYSQADINELQKFSRSRFDLENILSNASELKYAKQIKKHLKEEADNPSEEFIRMFTGRVYSGRFTSSVRDQFRVLVKNAVRSFVSEQVNDRLKAAIRDTGPQADNSTEANDEDFDDNGIVTTQEEIEGFHIVKALLAKHIAPSRIAMRDTKSYCGILLDDNNRKPLCRMHFNRQKKYVGLFDAGKNEDRVEIGSVQDMYAFENRLVASISNYDANATSTGGVEEAKEVCSS